LKKAETDKKNGNLRKPINKLRFLKFLKKAEMDQKKAETDQKFEEMDQKYGETDQF